MVYIYSLLGDFYTRIRFDVASHLAVIFLLKNSFIYQFLKIIFVTERKFAPWQSQPVVFLTNETPSLNETIVDKSEKNVTFLECKPVLDENEFRIQIARRVVLNRFPQHPVLITTKTHEFLTIELNGLSKCNDNDNKRCD